MTLQSDSTGNNRKYDGYYELTYQQDGVYLTVHPSVANGKKVTISDVLNKLARKQLRCVDRAAVETAVMKAIAIPMKIAENQEEVKIDASMNIIISPDKMKVYVVIIPPDGGKMLTYDQILKKIEENGIKYGIKRDVIGSLILNPTFNQQILVAEGIEPIYGINGKLQYFFDIHKDKKPTIMEDGRINFRELNLIDNVANGQVLVTASPPTPGQSGKNVLGINLPALDGKPAVLPRGKNVEISSDGQSLLSSLDGYINFIDGKVNVYSLYEVPADVDNSTGNISFVGNVIVRGNVLSGFSIEAGGSVEVFGVVEGATIKAGGSIILRRGMQGLGKGILISEGDIVARYIEHSNIHARGDIRAEAIMHSNIKCGNKLQLSGKKGLLVGGTAKVGMEISVKVIGSPMATVTDIEVGLDPTLRERYKEVKEEIKVAEADIKKAEQVIVILRKLQQVGTLSPGKQEMLDKSIRTQVYYNSKLGSLKEELLKYDDAFEQECNGRILIQNSISPGTKVVIGTAMLNIRENLQYCCLFKDGADIRVGTYSK